VGFVGFHENQTQFLLLNCKLTMVSQVHAGRDARGPQTWSTSAGTSRQFIYLAASESCIPAGRLVCDHAMCTHSGAFSPM
jgi:hypothetical protein